METQINELIEILEKWKITMQTDYSVCAGLDIAINEIKQLFKKTNKIMETKYRIKHETLVNGYERFTIQRTAEDDIIGTYWKDIPLQASNIVHTLESARLMKERFEGEEVKEVKYYN